jgi:hypothetical protein
MLEINHWNHRVVRRVYKTTNYEEESFAIHEAYYDDDGNVTRITQDPVDPHGSSMEDLRWSLNKMRECLEYPVLDYETMKEIEDDVSG